MCEVLENFISTNSVTLSVDMLNIFNIFAHEHESHSIKREKMDIFPVFREHLAMCGIIVEKLPLNSHSINLYSAKVIVLACFYGISIVKLVDEANTFEEYTDILNRMILVNLFTISYIDIVCKTSELIKLVDNLENSIKRSE